MEDPNLSDEQQKSLDTVKQILVDQDFAYREKVYDYLFGEFCRYCFDNKPEIGYCTCWNDE